MTFRRFVPVLAALLLALSAAPTHAVTFGPDLSSATADYPYSCSLAWAWQGCTLQDPLAHDMQLFLPDPVVHGNQTGVITAIHVKAAASAPAQFIVIEWSGQRNTGNPFPSGVMALSEQVTLQPGINDFNTNLPVDRRLASNGFESWSVVALNILDGTSPIPAQSGGSFATTGIVLDNGAPLTQTTADLTVPPHNVAVGGMPPAKLLMTGELTITTPPAAGGATGGTTTATTAPADTAATAPGGDAAKQSTLTLPATARLKRSAATLALQCAGAGDCTGTLRIQSRATGKRRTYASGTFYVPAGTTASLKLKLSKAGRKAARGHRPLRAYANATFGDGRVTSARITLKRR